jgi:hypothetical protein
MATPVGAILCVGMLGLGSVILVAMAIASAFIVVPAEDWPPVTVGLLTGGTVRHSERHYSTVV